MESKKERVTKKVGKRKKEGKSKMSEIEGETDLERAPAPLLLVAYMAAPPLPPSSASHSPLYLIF